MLDETEIEKMLLFMKRLARLGPVAVAVEMEENRGHRVVRPGDRDWLPKADWCDETICSISGPLARLVLLVARHPRKGAFTRLLAAVRAAGLYPVVASPTGSFEAYLVASGWRQEIVGTGFLRDDLWHPPEAHSPGHEAALTASGPSDAARADEASQRADFGGAA